VLIVRRRNSKGGLTMGMRASAVGVVLAMAVVCVATLGCGQREQAKSDAAAAGPASSPATSAAAPSRPSTEGAKPAQVVEPGTVANANESVQMTACLDNLKQIALAMGMYNADYDRRFPVSANWTGVLTPYLKDTAVYHCPAAEGSEWGYAMNKALISTTLPDMRTTPTTVVFFDSTLLRLDAVGGPEAIAARPRHRAGNNFTYADGHAKWSTNKRGQWPTVGGSRAADAKSEVGTRP
jgi:prepilin-type processing-associated H-X9-DG protein